MSNAYPRSLREVVSKHLKCTAVLGPALGASPPLAMLAFPQCPSLAAIVLFICHLFIPLCLLPISSCLSAHSLHTAEVSSLFTVDSLGKTVHTSLSLLSGESDGLVLRETPSAGKCRLCCFYGVAFAGS